MHNGVKDMEQSTQDSLLVVRASDIDCSPPHYPRVKTLKRGMFLEVCRGRDYKIPEHPIKVLGLLHHLSGKIWADNEFFFYAIQRIATAKGWKIHPFQGGEVSVREAARQVSLERHTTRTSHKQNYRMRE
jgi:hypothetical protein